MYIFTPYIKYILCIGYSSWSANIAQTDSHARTHCFIEVVGVFKSHFTHYDFKLNMSLIRTIYPVHLVSIYKNIDKNKSL